MGRGDEQHSHEVIADAACDLENKHQQDKREHQTAAGQIVEAAPEHGETAVPLPLHLLLDEKLVSVVDEGGAKEGALQSHRDDRCRERAERPHEDQGLGREDRDDRGRQAREDVSHARAGGDDREDALALEHVEVLGGETPEVEHDELERN